MFCTNCRAEIQEGTKFCTKCGAPVPQLNPVAQEISRQMATKDVPNIAPDLNSSQKSGAGAKKIALIAGLIGVAAALVGVIAYLLFFTEIGERVQSTFAGTAKEEEVDVDEIGGSKKSKDEDEEELTEEVVAEEEEVENAVFTGQRKPVDIQVRQVDNTNFPEITLYANVLDENGNNVENLTSSDLVVKEIAKDGSILDASIEDVYRLKQADKININLVLD